MAHNENRNKSLRVYHELDIIYYI